MSSFWINQSISSYCHWNLASSRISFDVPQLVVSSIIRKSSLLAEMFLGTCLCAFLRFFIDDWSRPRNLRLYCDYVSLIYFSFVQTAVPEPNAREEGKKQALTKEKKKKTSKKRKQLKQNGTKLSRLRAMCTWSSNQLKTMLKGPTQWYWESLPLLPMSWAATVWQWLC